MFNFKTSAKILKVLTAFSFVFALFQFSSPVSAVEAINVDGSGGGKQSSVSCANCYHVVITGSDNSTIVGFADNIGAEPDSGTINATVELSLTYTSNISGERKTVRMNAGYGAEYYQDRDPTTSNDSYSMDVYINGTKLKTISNLTAEQVSYYKVELTDPSGKKIPNASDHGSPGSSCYLVVNDLDDPEEINVIAHSQTGDQSTKITQEDINNSETVDVTATSNVGTTTNDNATSDTSDKTEQTVATCSNSGGALSLGWIVCPIMQWAKDAANDIYKDYVEPSLRIEPQLFNTSNGNTANAHAAWSTFRDIANIVFVIFLLLVILSQVTGIGIDNYGIKKSLPKLIVAAILVNVSYYICMGAIDISNIIGNGIQSVFDGLSVGDPQAIEGVSNLAGEIGSTAISAVGIAVALFAAGAVIWKNPAIVLTFLVSLLGLIISIFFLFVLLVAREAMIIVLTVLSPLAFVCYMLPNTKNTYDKWFKALKALLFVYPVCSLLVAGGDWLSRLLLAAGYGNGGLIRAFTAMLVGILPIFFIPSVLKSSMSVMGNVGAKLSGLGKVARGYSTSKIRSSESFKNLQRKGLERKNEKASGWDPRTGQLTRIGKYKARIAGSKFGQATGYAKAQAAKIALAKKNTEQEKTAAAELLGVTAATDVAEYIKNTGNKREDYYGEQLEQAGATGDLAKVEGVLQTMKSAGLKDKDIAAKLRGAIASNKIKFANDGSRMTWMTKMAAQEGNGYLATDLELTKYMQMGGDKAGAVDLATHGRWAGANLGVDDIKPEEVTRLSGESLAGLAQAGLITQSMAQQVMAKNPNLSADRQIMLGAVASGNAHITNAKDFAKEAKALASNPAATSYFDKDTGTTRVISSFTPVSGSTLADSVNAWTRPTPMAVNTVQDFRSGAYSGQAAPVETHDHVQDANVHGRDTSYRKYGQRGMYHQAPHGWVYDPSASAPGRPVFTNPDDPSRHYDAQANKYF